MPRAARPGFTLIELLIVVVILGILAAVAIPKFNDSKRKAQVGAMKGALRTALTAAEAYFADHHTYVGFTFPVADPVLVAPGMRSSTTVELQATHANLPGVVCRAYLGATDAWGWVPEGTVLRQGQIGGALCK